jgi:hypothetical protein
MNCPLYLRYVISCVYSATRSGADVVINAAEGGKGKNKDLQGLKKFGAFMFGSFHNVL